MPGFLSEAMRRGAETPSPLLSRNGDGDLADLLPPIQPLERFAGPLQWIDGIDDRAQMTLCELFDHRRDCRRHRNHECACHRV